MEQLCALLRDCLSVASLNCSMGFTKGDHLALELRHFRPMKRSTINA